MEQQWLTNQLTPSNRIILQKLISDQVVKKIPHILLKPKVHRSFKRAPHDPYSETDQSSTYSLHQLYE